MHVVGLIVVVLLPLACAGSALSWVAGSRSPNKKRWDRLAVVASFTVCVCLLFTEAIPMPRGIRLPILALAPAAITAGIALLIWPHRRREQSVEGEMH